MYNKNHYELDNLNLYILKKNIHISKYYLLV